VAVGLLLDTHAVYRWLDDDPRLGRAAREAVLAAPRVVVSTVSLWEFAIKLSLGRLRFDLGEAVRRLALDGFERLGVEDRHCRRYADLPPRHRDPFDRMLVAQALEEGLTLLSGDRAMPLYREAGLALLPCC
jgi:PIN domain nuclease of toxin-antitoxin system